MLLIQHDFSKGCDILSVSTSDIISDHFSIVANFKLPTNHSHTIPQAIICWKLKAINIAAFKADIKNSELIKYPKTNATELAQQYNRSQHSHWPSRSTGYQKIKISPKTPNPWRTPDISASKRHGRYLERIWHRNPTVLNISQLTRQTHLCHKLMSKAKSAHYSQSIA